MSSILPAAARVLATALLCAVCWWLWTADHGLAHLLSLDALDLQVRVAAIFAFLSLSDLASTIIGRHGSRS